MTDFFSAPITGAKFFAIFASFFFVIIAVNFVLAYEAIHTFPGLEVDNTYVASQTFDAERTAQLALGWTVRATVAQGTLSISITDKDGAPVKVASISGIFGRATSTLADQTPNFVFDGTSYRAAVLAGPGNWNFRLQAVARDGTGFHQRLIVSVN